MHRKTTSRRENKRIASGRLRAAEKNAIDNGSGFKTVYAGSWAHRATQPPLMNEVCNGTSRKKQKSEKKIACPLGPKGKHQFLTDIGVFERHTYWPEWSRTTDRPLKVQEIRRYRMCVHCGEVQVKFARRSFVGGAWYSSCDTLVRSATEKERELA